MITIHKFPLDIIDSQVITTHAGATILSAGCDPRGQMCIWLQVDTDKPVEDIDILIVGTGNPCPGDAMFIGTVVLSHFVWHVFEAYGRRA